MLNKYNKLLDILKSVDLKKINNNEINYFKNKKILITGVSGIIGINLLFFFDALNNKKKTKTVIDGTFNTSIFPFVKNPFNKLGNDGRREFMQKLNDTLLSGDYRISAETGKTEFGLMDKNKIKEITEMMIKKGGSEKDVKGVKFL